MPECVHHWRQEPYELRAPFIYLRCGSVREFETNFFALLDQRESDYSFRRANGAQQQSIAEKLGAGSDDQESPPNPRVLVVDDEAITVLMIKRVLEEQLACEVETALNGRQALEKAEQFRPDLTLLDIGMPDISGFEVCRGIKDNPLTAGGAIVYVSAYPKPADEQAVGYISKPLEPSSLLRTVRGLVVEEV